MLRLFLFMHLSAENSSQSTKIHVFSPSRSETYTRALPRRAHGAALTSSTGSQWMFCQLWRCRSKPYRMLCALKRKGELQRDPHVMESVNGLSLVLLLLQIPVLGYEHRLEALRGDLHHHEPRLRRPDGASREPQGSLQVGRGRCASFRIMNLSLAFTLLSPASDLVPWWCPTPSSSVRSCLLPRASAVPNIWPRSLSPCIRSVKSSCPAR